MYLLNAEVTLNWVLGATANPPVVADLDLIIINPNGESNYIDSPISALNFTAPTDTIDGAASYVFTPTIEGHWKLRLVIGDALNYTILSKVELQVMDSLSIVEAFLYPASSECPMTIPAAGLAGQVLGKLSDDNYNIGWVDQTGGGTEPTVPSTSEYCPGYTYEYVSANTFYVKYFNVTNIFSIGRRLKLTVNGIDIYGSITAVDYDITSVNDTFITLSMEDSAVLTVDLTEVCLVAGISAWSPISETPFGDYAVRDVVCGAVNLVNYWVICGDNGNLAYSTNGGLNWTSVVTGTVQNLHKVEYDPENERFMVAGRGAVVLTSSNGTTWALDTTILAANLSDGSGDIKGLVYHLTSSAWHILMTNAVSTNRTYYSYDFGSTWTYADSVGLDTNLTVLGMATATPVNIILANENGGDAIYYWTSVTSTGLTLVWNPEASPVTALDSRVLNAEQWLFIGRLDGSVTVRNNNTAIPSIVDAATFSEAHRGLVYSEFLNRIIVVGDNAQIGYIDEGNFSSIDAWTLVSNGLSPLANFTAVHFDEGTDKLFIAVADNGQILRSTNGVV